MVALPFPVFDADHHLYEPAEAFLRHLPKAFAQDFYFVEVRGRAKLVIDGQLSDYIPNPTFEVVAAPGTHEIWYRAENHDGRSMRELSGKPIRPPAEWRSGADRLKSMDQQGIHAALVFPTLASVIEARLGHKPETTAALFTSFNMWLNDEWGLAREGRLFAVPFISLADVGAAIHELEVQLARGARCIGIRPAPVPGLRGSLSLGSMDFDPFWARGAEAGIFVCLHASDSGYDQIARWWMAGSRDEYRPFDKDPFSVMLEPLARPITDAICSLIAHGALDRHPNLRIVSVENGSDWVGNLFYRFDRAYGQMPGSFTRHPRETFLRQVFVAPSYEDDMHALAKLLPAERILFGSDFPHPEGLAEPLDYLKEFEGFSDHDIKRIFHANLKGLLEGARD